MLSDQWIFSTHNSLVLSQELQTQFRFAQPPADIENVARPRSQPKDRVTRTHFAHDCRINEDFLPPRGVPTRQHTLELVGRAPHSAQEQIQPRPPGDAYPARNAFLPGTSRTSESFHVRVSV